MMRGTTRWGCGLALVAAALAACGPQMRGGAPTLLAGSAWRLTELNGRAPVASPGDGVPTLQFDASEPRASGNGGCNQYTGPYTQDGSSLRFGPIVATRRACVDEAANRQETEFLEALHSTTRFRAVGGELVLYAGDRPVAEFRSSGG